MHGKYKVNRGKSMVNVFRFKTRQLLRAICKTTLIEKLTNAVVHKERLTKDSHDIRMSCLKLYTLTKANAVF